MKIVTFFQLIVFTIIIFSTSSLLAAEKANITPKKVFVVHSYSKNNVCGLPQGEGVTAGLISYGWIPGQTLELRSHYMDTKIKNFTPEALKREAEIVLQKIRTFKPQVVVVLDDNAIREVMLPLVGDPDISLVFTGMNAQPESYSKEKNFFDNKQRPGHNVTGVYEKLYVTKSIAVMEAALTDFRKGDKMVGITDHTPTGDAVTRQFELEINAKNNQKFSWEVKRVSNFSEYKTLIRLLNADPDVRAIYPVALALKNEAGEMLGAEQILAWTIEHSTKPEMALNYFFSKIGLFGGAAVDFFAMGKQAGKKAGQILSGTFAGDIAIEDATDYAIVFNLDRAKSLDINIPPALMTAADEIYQNP